MSVITAVEQNPLQRILGIKPMGPVIPSGRNAGLQAYLNDKTFENPPIDPRLLSHPWLNGLQRGRMQQTQDWVRSLTQGNAGGGVAATKKRLAQAQINKARAVNFAFNPSDITINYSVNSNVLPSTQLTPAQAAASAVYPGMTSLSFSLLFDRTYEVNDGNDIARQIGVYADIGAFELMTGAADPVVGSQNMQFIPIVVVFGGGVAGTINQFNSVGLSYVGFVNSATVTYGHFTNAMVPVRASLDITMTLLIGESPSEAVSPDAKNTLTIADADYSTLFQPPAATS